ncbi:MAG: 2-hydroxyacyl-CoA dehydratase family protein, partial [Desulfobacterales bacterium]
IYQIIEGSGGAIVWDDTCTGSRYFEGAIDPNGDIIESIAQRYFERHVCPAKHSGLFNRGEHIVRIVKENNAQGVVFLFLKFCDPHSFDYPYIKEMLNKEDIPSMLFEMEDLLSSKGQLKTRCEAFLETL